MSNINSVSQAITQLESINHSGAAASSEDTSYDNTVLEALNYLKGAIEEDDSYGDCCDVKECLRNASIITGMNDSNKGVAAKVSSLASQKIRGHIHENLASASIECDKLGSDLENLRDESIGVVTSSGKSSEKIEMFKEEVNRIVNRAKAKLENKYEDFKNKCETVLHAEAFSDFSEDAKRILEEARGRLDDLNYALQDD